MLQSADLISFDKSKLMDSLELWNGHRLQLSRLHIVFDSVCIIIFLECLT